VLIEEILHSCANDKVAHAAVLSIGGDFAKRVRVAAGDHGLTAGAFTAYTVQHFQRSADEKTRLAVAQVMSGSDQPILAGLRQILEPALTEFDIDLDNLRTKKSRAHPGPMPLQRGAGDCFACHC
jgi:hypothetical protein